MRNLLEQISIKSVCNAEPCYLLGSQVQNPPGISKNYQELSLKHVFIFRVVCVARALGYDSAAFLRRACQLIFRRFRLEVSANRFSQLAVSLK